MSDNPEEPKDKSEKSRPKLSLVPNAKSDGSKIPLRPKKFVPPRPDYTYGYKAGQNVVCRVVKPEMGGYEVVIKKSNFPGYIKTHKKLEPFSEILAKFVCVHRGRALVSPIFEDQCFEDRPSLKTVESPDNDEGNIP